ncbi:MAG TPA: hypothetical protein VKE51_32270 [Vicinamibacterales bacterium]|nr:hypothetical protein [Vicinamibacterales bacterium]
MAERVLTVVCAWCQCTVTAPPSAAGVTHTICPACLASMLDDLPPDEAAADPLNLESPEVAARSVSRASAS